MPLDSGLVLKRRGNRFTVKLEGRGRAGYPLIGHLPPFLYDKLGFLSRCAAIYGDVIKLKIGEPTFLMNNPEDIKHILIVNPDNYLKSPRMTSAGGKRLSGGGLLTSVGAAHLKQRRMMQPVFYRKTVETFSKTITEGIGQMLAQWTDRSELNLGREMMGLVQRNIVKSVLGSDVDNEMPALLDAGLQESNEALSHRFVKRIGL